MIAVCRKLGGTKDLKLIGTSRPIVAFTGA